MPTTNRNTLRRVRFAVVALIFSFGIARAAQAQQLQFASLGDVKLQSGEVLRDCRIGYRTYGALNADKSNVILIPTWAGGTTEQLAAAVGPGRLADSGKYYVITVDALSNGVSSSPSNSPKQPRMKFPRITIRDMVETQHILLTRVLSIPHVKAVMGISMGGMQTFQWIVAYPGFMDKAIPIVGSPRLAAYDLMQWQTQIDAVVNDARWKNGNYKTNFIAVQEAEFGAMVLTTPQHYNAHTTRQQVFEELQKAKADTGGQDASNKVRQVQAMMALDVSQPFGGSMEQAAAAVKAKVFVVVSRFDHTVTPQPALDFANQLQAPTLLLEGDCGHEAPGCEEPRLMEAVSAFLEN